MDVQNQSNVLDLKNEIGQSTWVVVFLNAITGGVYTFIWLNNRCVRFNEIAGKVIITTDNIVQIAALTFMGVVLLAVPPIGVILLISGYGLLFIIDLRIAKAIEAYYAKNFKLDIRFNKFFLAVLAIYYINYMINDVEEVFRRKMALAS